VERFFKDRKPGIQPAHANKLQQQLATLDSADEHLGMNIPGGNLHQAQCFL
jgi:plasmid maintenance system killer protein